MLITRDDSLVSYRWWLLGAIFLAALAVRLYASQDYGRDWYGPGSFTLINFDEGGSCRAALDGFPYTPFVGYQTLWLAGLQGVDFDPSQAGDARAIKAFCHAGEHISVARAYSAMSGALTVPVIAALALLLFPSRWDIALGAAALLAASGWHISESMVGTVDAPSTFFIYSFSAAALWALARGGWRWLAAVLLAVPAFWTKYWVFVLLSLAVLMPPGIYPQLLRGVSRRRLIVLITAYAALFGVVTNPALPMPWHWVLPLGFYPLLPWRRMSLAGRLVCFLLPWLAPLALQLDLFVAFTSGGGDGPLGAGYGAIGWHKPLRNLINVPVVTMIGLGLPAFIALGLGLRRLVREPVQRSWLVLLPLPAFLLYMLFLAPVTYYRHYLPLLPAACLIAALGICSLPRPRIRPVWALALVWQVALAVDLVSDYFVDPRRQLPAWYTEHRPTVVMSSYYVSPPPNQGAVHRLFRAAYADDDGARLRLADTLILSENWYDTAFANELNGPLVHDTRKLIKTTPQAAAFYRAAVAGEHPYLEPAAYFPVPAFMPEMLLHRAAYGSFTQFVGDLRLYRVRR